MPNEGDDEQFIQHTNLLIDENWKQIDETKTIANFETQNNFQTKSSRGKWDNDIEFLFSCIALSVGLGNVWRFPFIALQNGGGAFVIPYIFVLILIGRPIYYMEVVIGQFSSRGCIKAFSFAPLMRGVAYGQIYATALATTYYACIMALTIKYLMESFSSTLPWGYCKPEWNLECIDSSIESFTRSNSTINRKSSAEIYFIKEVLNEVDTLDNGIGNINWNLVGCLAIAWCIIGTVLIKGIQSSGKAAYFLGIFPYIVLLILFIRAITLPGSMNGIIYFLRPQWDQLLNPKVWYNAITQVFFSLAICFGTLIMYASYNKFHKNMYKDLIIITAMDSVTSILAGCIIFGILGNLAYETNTTDISSVVKGGTGLAFISYPDAIAKFQFLPQVFAVLFFMMLLVLGIGSNIGMTSSVITVIKDRFTTVPLWLLSMIVSTVGFSLGIVYMTPGGQFIISLIDFFGTSFVALVLAIAQLISVGWVYGVKRFCEDIEFMLGIKTSLYWRICWGILTPGLMILVLIYSLLNYEPITYKGTVLPEIAYNIGWIISAIGILQLPGWAIYHIYKQPPKRFIEKVVSALKPADDWGPLDERLYEEYVKFRADRKDSHPKLESNLTIWEKCFQNIFR